MASSGMLTEVFSSLEQAERNLENEALRIIAELQDEIVKYNTDQLYAGQDAKGQKLKPSYSRVKYARAKNSMNSLPGLGNPDLKVTGKFYRGFYLTAKNGKFEFFSSDEKTDDLKAKYGSDIFGLTKENEQTVNFEKIYPRLLQWILNQLRT